MYVLIYINTICSNNNNKWSNETMQEFYMRIAIEQATAVNTGGAPFGD